MPEVRRSCRVQTVHGKADGRRRSFQICLKENCGVLQPGPYFPDYLGSKWLLVCIGSVLSKNTVAVIQGKTDAMLSLAVFSLCRSSHSACIATDWLRLLKGSLLRNTTFEHCQLT